MSSNSRDEGATRSPDAAQLSKLRRDILRHLKSLQIPGPGGKEGPSNGLNKEAIRRSHFMQRRYVFRREHSSFGHMWPELLGNFANGDEVDPRQIRPELVEVRSDTAQAYLFRLACLLWSVPVSRGYGRRMRYLVVDRQNGRLIGLFALNDPVFNLKARDDWIGWTADDRRKRLVNVMDAHVVGAVPPYSALLGGKLVACLMGSREVVRAFRVKYANRKGVISNERKHARLLMITVTSALGRSSLYNRLRLGAQGEAATGRFLVNAIRLGETRGYGHYQLSESLFLRIRELLASEDHSYASGYQYGQGPNWRMRVIREGLKRLGLDGELLRHGVHREVFAIPLSRHARKYLRGERKTAAMKRPDAGELSRAAIERWVLPRASRDGSFRDFRREEIWNRISPDEEALRMIQRGFGLELD